MLTNDAQQPQKGTERSLRVDLLGVPAISWQGAAMGLTRRQARAILYRLAYEGKPLGREKLADLLWPEKEPAAARRNLVRLLSLLRGELPEKALLGSDNTAVWLNPDLVRCDVQDFLHLRESKTTEDWKTAVALYRGSFLSGFSLDPSYTFDDWQQACEHDLEQRYLELLARLVKKTQAIGDTAQAITYARRYLAIDDLAETIHRALIALYAARGERTAALQQYSRCVDILHKELGVDPLPETRAVYEAARDGDLSPKPLPVPAPTWATLPGLEMPLTGREEAWRELEEAYRQEGTGGAILIGGAPGVGKSRLMQEFASRQAGPVLVGNCHTGSQALFFQPLVQALRQGLIGTDQGRQVKAIWLAELTVLIPELRDQYPDLPPPLPLAPVQSQARLLEALAQAFRGLVEESRLLLCLDDLHAADEGTLAWLNYATGQLAGSGVCVMVTYRSQQGKTLTEWQRALSRSGRGRTIRLGNLDGQAVESLMELAGAAVATAVALAPGLHDATGGNAYFLLETIRELLESGGLQAGSAAVPLPQTVREAVLRRANRLSPLTRQVLDMAAVLSPLLEIPLLAKTSARSELEVAGALDDLVRRQLLIPQDARFRFQHDLTREAIYREISDWRTRLLHRRAAQILEQRVERQTEYLAVIATHYEAAGDFPEAITGYRQAAVEAQAINAFSIAAGYLRSAIELLPPGIESDAMRSDLLERLGDSLRLTAQFDDALAQYGQALSVTPEDEALIQSRILRKTAETLWPMNRTAAAIETSSQAAEALQPHLRKNEATAWPEWVQIHLVKAWINYWNLDLNGVLNSLAEIKDLLNKPGFIEQKQRFFAYASLGEFLRRRYRLDSNIVDTFQTHFDVAKQEGNLYLIADTEFRLGFSSLWNGDLAAARQHLGHSLRISEELAVHLLWVQNATYLMVTARLMGDVTAVADQHAQTMKMAENVGSLAYISTMRALGSWLAYREENIERALSEAQEAVNTWELSPIPFQWLARWVLLAVALDENRLQDAIVEARVMTTPPQYLQDEPVNDALETAVSLWDEGQTAAAREVLVQAKCLAEEANYL